MLDNREAGADTRSTGLLASVNPIAATAGGGTEAIITDLANLASACAGVGGLDLLYICGPSAAVKIALLAPLLKIPVTCSAAVADDQVVCLAPGALVIGGSADPVEISVSRETVLHTEDTSPTQLTESGTPCETVRWHCCADFIDSLIAELAAQHAWDVLIASRQEINRREERYRQAHNVVEFRPGT